MDKIRNIAGNKMDKLKILFREIIFTLSLF